MTNVSALSDRRKLNIHVVKKIAGTHPLSQRQHFCSQSKNLLPMRRTSSRQTSSASSKSSNKPNPGKRKQKDPVESSAPVSTTIQIVQSPQVAAPAVKPAGLPPLKEVVENTNQINSLETRLEEINAKTAIKHKNIKEAETLLYTAETLVRQATLQKYILAKSLECVLNGLQSLNSKNNDIIFIHAGTSYEECTLIF